MFHRLVCLMNKSIVVTGGLIILAIVAGYLFFNYQSGDSTTITATSTPNVAVGADNVPVAVNQIAGLPFATTNATVAPTDTTAVVTGTVLPMGANTSYWYEYGATANLGSKTSTHQVGSGYTALKTPGYITGLTRGTSYYYRVVAQNQFGTVAGITNTFTTTTNSPNPVVGKAPTAKTLAATDIATTSAMLAGEVNANQAAAHYWFEYGPNNNLGGVTALVSAGSGTDTQAVAVPLSSLASKTTYFYRMNAQNQFGTVNGTVMTFKTK